MSCRPTDVVDVVAVAGRTVGRGSPASRLPPVDADIGHVDEVTYQTGSSYLVVDTGPWIFGNKVMLQAGVVERIDTAENKIYVDLPIGCPGGCG